MSRNENANGTEYFREKGQPPEVDQTFRKIAVPFDSVPEFK